MSQNAYKMRSTQPDVVAHTFRITGTGAADPTLTLGSHAAITRTGTGAYLITWTDAPGTFVGFTYGLGAATPAALAGHTVVHDDFSSSTIPFILYDASEAAHDLAASEYITLSVLFKTTSVSGA